MDSKYRHSVRLSRMAVILLLGVVPIVLTSVFLFAAPAGKNDTADKNTITREDTQLFRRSYDEVFEATQEAIERKGWFIESADKKRGVIALNFVQSQDVCIHNLEVRLEPITSADGPQTRVVTTLTGVRGTTDKYTERCLKRHKKYGTETCWDGFFPEIQKVLATYR